MLIALEEPLPETASERPPRRQLALAVGSSGSTFTDHGMRWDNSGKNGHYAPISWSS
jgi:hypothetical protein